MPAFKKLSYLGLLLAFIAPALSAQDLPPGHGGDDPPPPSAKMEEKMLRHMQKDLNLTQDQMEKMKAVHEKYRPKMEALHQKVEPLRKQLMQLLSSDSADRNTVEKVMRSLASMRVDMQLLMFDRHQEINGILTTRREAWSPAAGTSHPLLLRLGDCQKRIPAYEPAVRPVSSQSSRRVARRKIPERP